MEQVEEYLYLGIEVGRKRGWGKVKARLLRKARGAMAFAWGMGSQWGRISVKAGLQVWRALVRSRLEYAAVIWGDCKWEEAEAVEREMGKRILRCGDKMPNEVVLGDLGLWTLKGRRDMLRLRYYGKLVRMSESRWTKRLYNVSRANHQSGKPIRSWCKYTHAS